MGATEIGGIPVSSTSRITSHATHLRTRATKHCLHHRLGRSHEPWVSLPPSCNTTVPLTIVTTARRALGCKVHRARVSFGSFRTSLRIEGVNSHVLMQKTYAHRHNLLQYMTTYESVLSCLRFFDPCNNHGAGAPVAGVNVHGPPFSPGCFHNIVDHIMRGSGGRCETNGLTLPVLALDPLCTPPESRQLLVQDLVQASGGTGWYEGGCHFQRSVFLCSGP